MEITKTSDYVAPVDYLISTFIREYDIAKANINILLYKGLIGIEQYNYFYNLDKYERQVKVGLFLRSNPDISKALTEGFKEAMKLFFDANDIQQYEVLAIKKDAVYLINRVPQITTFGNLEFVEKNKYTSFYKINKLLLYYYNNNVTKEEYIHVKGMNDRSLQLHENHFLEFLLTVFSSAQNDPVEEVLDIIMTFESVYANRDLDIEYYRNFNNASEFSLALNSITSGFSANFIDNRHKNFLNIAHNHEIIKTLFRIFSGIYFQKNNKRYVK